MIKQHDHAPLVANPEQILRDDERSDLMNELESNGDEDVDWDDWALNGSNRCRNYRSRDGIS
jgi:hypothetical protein